MPTEPLSREQLDALEALKHGADTLWGDERGGIKAIPVKDLQRASTLRGEYLKELHAAAPALITMARQALEKPTEADMTNVMRQFLDGQALVSIARREADKEKARREFVQVYGRFIAWGLVGPNRELGVALYDEGYYNPARFIVLYPPNATDEQKDEATAKVIDLAMIEMAKITPGHRRDGWLHEVTSENRALREALKGAVEALRFHQDGGRWTDSDAAALAAARRALGEGPTP